LDNGSSSRNKAALAVQRKLEEDWAGNMAVKLRNFLAALPGNLPVSPNLRPRALVVLVLGRRPGSGGRSSLKKQGAEGHWEKKLKKGILAKNACTSAQRSGLSRSWPGSSSDAASRRTDAASACGLAIRLDERRQRVEVKRRSRPTQKASPAGGREAFVLRLRAKAVPGSGRWTDPSSLITNHRARP
jgi:hypothetical protein